MKCPKCSTPLAPVGDLDIDGRRADVYQCDTCTVPWAFGGETISTAFTFAVDESGGYFDPESLKPLNLN